jgi:hypothetical protein
VFVGWEKKKCGQRSGFSFLCIFAKASKVPADSIFYYRKRQATLEAPFSIRADIHCQLSVHVQKKTCDFLDIDLSHF